MERMKKMKMKRIENVEIAGYKMDFTYEFFGKDGEKYVVLWKETSYDKTSLEFRIFSEKTNEILPVVSLDVDIMGKCRHIANIFTDKYEGLGFGTALMITFFDVVITKEPNHDVIVGTFCPKYDEENTRLFYKSFNELKINDKIIIFKGIQYGELQYIIKR